MICGVCKERDVDIAHVKGHGGVQQQPSRQHRESGSATTVTVTATEPQTSDVVPGRYALYNERNDLKWRFYLVDHGRKGTRWEGYTFVSELFGAPGDFRKEAIKDKLKRELILVEIVKDMRLAAINFGKEHGICGMCGSPLTDPNSIAAGIGPVCARNQGW